MQQKYRIRKHLSFAAAFALSGISAQAQLTGPSSSDPAYIVPVASGVITKSIITSGNDADPSAGIYKFPGIADGMGVYDNGDGTMTVLTAHEFGPTVGTSRDHGAPSGAFVSELTVNKTTLTVTGGDDLIKSVLVWNTTTSAYQPANPLAQGDSLGSIFNRFCSADLAAVSAFYNSSSGLGTTDRIFLTGEETRPPFSSFHGRQFGIVATGAEKGTAYELARLGNAAWENYVFNPFEQNLTVGIGLDDSDASTTKDGNSSELYMYVGTKTSSGTAVDKAGLTNGNLYAFKLDAAGVSTTPITEENQANGFDTTIYTDVADFTFYNHGNVENDGPGLTQQANDDANGVTSFRRIEDGAWDPGNSNKFYFVTTDSFDSTPTAPDGGPRSRLFEVTFNDITNPTAGGQIKILINGVATVPTDGSQLYGPQMMDNMTAVLGLDGLTRILIQEDVGNNAHLGNIWMFTPATDELELIATHDSTRFLVGGANYLGTQDEEASGIIPAWDLLGVGWFLMSDQAHTSSGDAETAEKGQMLAIYIPQAIPEPSSALLVGFAVALFGARRRRD